MPLDKEFVQAVTKYAHKQDQLVLIDEVQTGNGRTGSLYAYQQFGIEPDVVSTAKGLAGGLPMGATLFNEKMQYVLKCWCTCYNLWRQSNLCGSRQYYH